MMQRRAERMRPHRQPDYIRIPPPAPRRRDYLFAARPAKPSIAAIKTAVCRHYSLSPIDMVSERRSREVAWPRQMAMYLASELTPHSLTTIGRMFGGRDHSTVVHARRAVTMRLSSVAEERAAHDAIRAVFSMGAFA